MVVAVERSLADAGEQRAESQCPLHVRAHHDRVDEQADRVECRDRPIRGEARDAEVGLAGVAADNDLVRGEEQHLQSDVGARCQSLQAAREHRRDVEIELTARVVPGCRPLPVRGQLENGELLQLAPPVRQELLMTLVANLPDPTAWSFSPLIRVPRGERGAGAVLAVQIGQLAPQHLL